jgi:hemerythrin-like domain-containing protein
MTASSVHRRHLVLLGGAAAAAALGGACASSSPAPSTAGEKDHETKGMEGKGADKKEEEVTPAEDLMREHGALNRILLVYEEGIRRLDAQGQPPIEVLSTAAGIVQRFIEDYHEKLEEDFLFPRFEKAGKLVDLVAVLRRQHDAGRRLTQQIQRMTAGPIDKPEARSGLATALRAFVRMYRPHEAREDTVLFPALRDVIEAKELAELGERFEDKEHELFGKEGFEGVVAQVATLEQQFGIHELDQFTPR